MRSKTNALGAMLLAAAVLLTACGTFGPQQSFHAHESDPPTPVPDFVLVAPDGARTALSDFRGRFVVVYFGYTHCPDVCPTTVGTFAAAFDQLPAQVRDRYRFVMVTVDPARDTPEIMGRYVAHFDPEFIGLSGSPAEIDQLISAWNLPVECGEVQADGSYSVGHPASAWVLDMQGRERLHVSFTATPEEVAADLQLLARKG